MEPREFLPVLRVVGGRGAVHERNVEFGLHAARLLESGHAYRCFCTPERLQQVREEQTARKEAPGYDRFCRDLASEVVQANLAAGMPSALADTRAVCLSPRAAPAT